MASPGPDPLLPGLQATLRGRVQGVGFRWFVRRTARALELAGWVANLPDGSVRVMASGSAESLARLVVALRHGPPGARVDGLETTGESPSADLPHPFEIR